jgi:hypothetical protein
MSIQMIQRNKNTRQTQQQLTEQQNQNGNIGE